VYLSIIGERLAIVKNSYYFCRFISAAAAGNCQALLVV